MLFEHGGPSRYRHQMRGLDRLIKAGGLQALLFDPGMGKTAVVLDYASILALKSTAQEVRVLVVCPLVAVDTWVLQAEKFMSPQVSFWAEVLGGSLLVRAEALAARGGAPYRTPQGYAPRIQEMPKMPPSDTRPEEHNEWYQLLLDVEAAKRAHVRYESLKALHGEALHFDQSLAWSARRVDGEPVRRKHGPRALPGPRVILEVVNIDTLAYRTSVSLTGSVRGSEVLMSDIMLDAVRRYRPDVVVVDESHKIKSADAHASRLLARVSKVAQRRIILTGTVMPHGPLDVFGQWRFLDPYAFGELQPDGSRRQATFGGFRNAYAIMGGWMGKEVIGYQRLDEMQRIMSRLSTVARKEEALDLPPTTDVTVPVNLTPRETKAYNDMKDDLATLLANGELASVTSRLTQMLRLRQITAGHLPDDTGKLTMVGRSKVEAIKSLVHDSLVGEKRIVVFALFRAEITMLADALSVAGTTVQVITGDTSNEERQEMRRIFGSDDPRRIVMVAQIKTMSLAVNELVTANHAIFATLSQQRDDYIQARDRLNRIGQTKPVTFWHMIVPGTVDEVVLQSHRDRSDLENAMLRHIKDGAHEKKEK